MTNDEHSDGSETDGVSGSTELRFVGPSTAETIAQAPFDAGGISQKTVSYEMLVEAGVNPGVAGKLRREHSLPWSLGGENDTDESLQRRSDHVRGLQDEERAWVAASTGDWENVTADESGGDSASDGNHGTDGTAPDSTNSVESAESEESAWRERSSPDPVTEVDEIDAERERQLAEAGITSVRSLATANPERVADVLGLDEEHVRRWRDEADAQL